MTVIRGAEAPHFSLPGAEFTALAAPSRGSAQLCTWLLTVDPGREEPAPHTLDADEVFLVLSGTVQITHGGTEVGVGDCAVVPAGEPIALVNTGTEPARLHVAIRAGFTATMPDGSSLRPPWAS